MGSFECVPPPHIPPKPPDGNSVARKISFCDKLMGDKQPEAQVQTAETGGSAAEGAKHNPTIQKGETVAEERLHGEWISVTKYKRDPKRKGKDHAINVRGPNVGKDTVPGDQNGANDGVIFMAKAKESPQNMSPNPNLAGPNKIAKPINIGVGSQGTKSTGAMHQLVKQQHVTKLLPHNIKTTMDVEYVAPNRMRFIEEPKPPDPAACQGVLVDSTQDGRPTSSGEALSDQMGIDGNMGDEPNMMRESP
ncbi:Origin recognition complex subunit 5 [Sesbania bispinosa]|nr:Origin recognition complex subunit 5 [Sesbania bispinosa]